MWNAFTHKFQKVRLHHRLQVNDVPAEKLVNSFKGSGKFSDTFCDIEGVTVGSTVYFPVRDAKQASPRTGTQWQEAVKEFENGSVNPRFPVKVWFKSLSLLKSRGETIDYDS